MANTNKILYSNTAGNVPSSLANGQIAIQQADGRLFYRTPSGTVTQFAGGSSSLASYATTANLPATGSASTLYLVTSSSRLYHWVAADSVYAEVGTIGGIATADGGTYA